MRGNPIVATMQTKTLKSDLLLLLAAFFWGTTFVAQRLGMEHIGPMTYNALRFAVGALTLLPVILAFRTGRASLTGQLGCEPATTREVLLPVVRRPPGRSGPVRRRLDAADRPDLHDRRKGQLHHQSLRGARSHSGSVPRATMWLGGLGRCGTRRGRPVPAEHHGIVHHRAGRSVHPHRGVLLDDPRAPDRLPRPAGQSDIHRLHPVHRLFDPEPAGGGPLRDHRRFPPSAPRRCRSSTPASSRPALPSPCRSSASEPPRLPTRRLS